MAAASASVASRALTTVATSARRGGLGDQRQPILQTSLNLIPNAPKRSELRSVVPRGSGRVVEAPVEAPVEPCGVVREDRTSLVGAVADRNDVVPRLAQEGLTVFDRCRRRSIPTSSMARIATGC